MDRVFGKIKRLEAGLSIVSIMLVFWTMFWTLNGLDKFYNGTMEPMIESGLEQSILIDQNGNPAYTAYGYEINGLFGVNRNAKTVTFLERIGVPEKPALGLLYGIGVVELGLAGLFLGSAIQKKHGKKEYKITLRLAYKSSLLLFTVFCITDILIGERIELWEHTTFMAALLLSYHLVDPSSARRPKKT